MHVVIGTFRPCSHSFWDFSFAYVLPVEANERCVNLTTMAKCEQGPRITRGKKYLHTALFNSSRRPTEVQVSETTCPRGCKAEQERQGKIITVSYLELIMTTLVYEVHLRKKML